MEKEKFQQLTQTEEGLLRGGFSVELSAESFETHFLSRNVNCSSPGTLNKNTNCIPNCAPCTQTTPPTPPPNTTPTNP